VTRLNCLPHAPRGNGTQHMPLLVYTQGTCLATASTATHPYTTHPTHPFLPTHACHLPVWPHRPTCGPATSATPCTRAAPPRARAWPLRPLPPQGAASPFSVRRQRDASAAQLCTVLTLTSAFHLSSGTHHTSPRACTRLLYRRAHSPAGRMTCSCYKAYSTPTCRALWDG